jgi:porin
MPIPLVLAGSDMWCRILLCLVVGTTCVAVTCNLAVAQDAVGEPAPSREAPPPEFQDSIALSIPALGEFKKELLDLGLNFQLNYTGEVLGNPLGGVRQRAIYENLLELATDGDLQTIAGLGGASFHINSYIVNGAGLSTCCIFNVLTVSNIEALPSARLFEAWLEQKLFGNTVSLRVGQLAADREFAISEYSQAYLNATFGWPNIFAADMPSTGPNYPLATPGVRLKVSPTKEINLLAALFNGDPAGAGFTGLQEILDPSGINFRLRDPPLLMAEAQYVYNQEKNSPGLPGSINVGGWYHFGKFNDQRRGTDDLSLANPLSNGKPLIYRGDSGVYGMIDQMIWPVRADDPKRGVAGFAFLSTSPSDRNVANVYAELGITCIGIWNNRPNDTFGLAAVYSPASPSVSGLDADAALFAKAALPIRNYELALELTYQAKMMPGFYVQPDFQYIFHPGYGRLNPLNPTLGRIPDAAVFGVRAIVKF